ncbi:HIT-like protein [Morchella conica CCBAS932]|uniref:Adenosine 5'-monophosphoramidase HNT1 n=2 Tax=Morchella sect. Distantes TaxID=1051054 RepID=A0A3N4KXG1_9PEZI|nr:HIT-like protein [Morchella conica CCBAS932]
MSAAACIFCRIIRGEIPSFKLLETEKIFAFLDIQPLSKGHCLVIPKTHGERLHDVPDDELAELLPAAKKLALATGAVDYNILQNNGSIAHQVVGHVHVHMIPKPNEKEGLTVGWPAKETDMDALKALHENIKAKM